MVLGLSQGSVSELLSKPKPWHMLSIKGREPFIRMQLWLSDPLNIDRLQALRNERREASKRRRGSAVNNSNNASSTPGDNSSDTSSNDTSEFYHSTSPGPPAKKQRVLFSEEQKEALRLAFALDSYPNVGTIEFLANELQLSSRTITNWFHNHRMRLKQQVPHSPASPSPREQASPGGQTFDPVRFRMLLNQRLVELQKERLGAVGAGLGAGLPLPYPPYFAGNANLAALISRGLLPAAAAAGFAGLAGPEPKDFNGLDLSLKRESDDDEDDAMSNPGSEDSASDLARRTPNKPDPRDAALVAGLAGLLPGLPGLQGLQGLAGLPGSALAAPPGPPRSSSSRRKPAAPQWVNPDWQEAKDKEVIINGVCVMQTDDYKLPSRAARDEETVRVEPTAVLDADRYDAEHDDAVDSDDALSPRNAPAGAATSPRGSPLAGGDADDDDAEEMDREAARVSPGQGGADGPEPQERRHGHGLADEAMDEGRDDRTSPACSPRLADASASAPLS